MPGEPANKPQTGSPPARATRSGSSASRKLRQDSCRRSKCIPTGCPAWTDIPILPRCSCMERSSAGSSGRRFTRKSSKRVQCGEPVVLVPDLRYLTDSITSAQEIFPGSTQWISDPIKDSNLSLPSWNQIAGFLRGHAETTGFRKQGGLATPGNRLNGRTSQFSARLPITVRSAKLALRTSSGRVEAICVSASRLRPSGGSPTA